MWVLFFLALEATSISFLFCTIRLSTWAGWGNSTHSVLAALQSRPSLTIAFTV